jgi:hypothetical protein
MKEEYINYLFNWAQSDGFKGNRDEFIKKIQTDDNAYNYVLRYAKNDGYKGSDDDFSIAVGRGAAAPVATTEPAKTEPAKTEVAIATPVAETKPTVTPEPTKELRSEPMTTVKSQALPEKQVATPTVDMAKMPTMQVKSVEATPTKEEPMTAEKKEAVKSDIESQLLPVTEKTEVKAIETPSDKMVIKSEAKVEPKPVEEVKGVPSYDDLGINTEKDPGAFLDATFDKNTKFEKMSPSELIEKDIFAGRGSNIKLERNKSLRYPDPPGTVFQKEKVGDKEYYSSYDKTNNKWYIYDENSSKNSWTEVKKGPIETLLNSKFIQGGNKIVESKVDYNSEEENYKINKIREGVLLNKYLPYIMKNYDNLNETEKKKLKEDFRSYNILTRKYIDSNDPNLDFWLDVNDKLFNNQATSSNAISFIQNDHDTYPPKLIRISDLNADIKKENVKVLKSVAGDIFYDNKNDLYYYGESFDRKDLKTEMGQYGTPDGKGGIIYEERPYETYFKVIPKGTPAYDKIKSSLSKYNK